jgi:hypothetical protein
LQTREGTFVFRLPPGETQFFPTVAELIARIHDLIRNVRGDEVQLKAVGPGAGVRYYVDPNPPKIFFDPPPPVHTRLDNKYPNPTLARKQIIEQSRKLIELAGLLAGAPNAESAELYWLVRLRTESPHFHVVQSGGWINDVLQATIELLKHLDQLGTLGTIRTAPPAPLMAIAVANVVVLTTPVRAPKAPPPSKPKEPSSSQRTPAALPTVAADQADEPGLAAPPAAGTKANPGNRKGKRSKPPARGTPPSVLRPGHAAEITQYKVKKGFTTDAQAARALGVSEAVLKSIKSSRGRLRCSQGMLQGVLDKIAKALNPSKRT